jgi:hypothetical protein
MDTNAVSVRLPQNGSSYTQRLIRLHLQGRDEKKETKCQYPELDNETFLRD